jgi:hypothetical protein
MMRITVAAVRVVVRLTLRMMATAEEYISPSPDKANLAEITSNTKDDKSDSSSASHKSNHHTDSISKRDLTGDNNINNKMDRLKNRILENDNDRQHRDKIPLKLPIPFP